MSVVIDGLDELLQELTNAPKEIRQEAFGILREETEGARSEIATEYSRRSKSGTLASRVETYYPAESALIGIVRSTAPHSHLIEFGTKQRFTKRYGNKRQAVNRGAVEGDKVTPKIAQRHRDQLYRRLADMLERRGYVLERDE